MILVRMYWFEICVDKIEWFFKYYMYLGILFFNNIVVFNISNYVYEI